MSRDSRASCSRRCLLEQRIELAVDQPGHAATEEGEALTDARLLRWLLSPAEAPAPFEDGSARYFRAVGEVNEVRGVLRRCLGGEIPLDEVEVLCTDVATYVPLIYERSPRLHRLMTRRSTTFP